MTANVWRAFYHVLYVDKNPDVKLLTRFLSIKKPVAVAEVGDYELKNLRTKLKAMKEEIPTIARTMTCGQLHKAGYASWVKGLSAKDIESVNVLAWSANIDKDSAALSAMMDTLIYRYQLDWGLCKAFTSKFHELRSRGYSIDDAIAMAQK